MNDSTFIVQAILGTLVAFLMQWLKKAAWFPWLTDNTMRYAKVVWSVVLAATSALAIDVIWAADTGTLTITGLTWGNVEHGLVLFLSSLFSQQTAYSLLVKTMAKSPLTVDLSKVKLLILPLILVCTVGASGCGASRSKPRHIATGAETGFKTAIQAFGNAEKALYESKLVPQLTLDLHRQINGRLVRIDEAGIHLTTVLLAWQEGKPTPTELTAIVTNVRGLIDDIGTMLPESENKSKLLGFLATAEGWLLAILTPILTQATGLVPVWAMA